MKRFGVSWEHLVGKGEGKSRGHFTNPDPAGRGH